MFETVSYTTQRRNFIHYFERERRELDEGYEKEKRHEEK
jgi:hypothetical protein